MMQFGIADIDMPLTTEAVWRGIRDATPERAA
jgi:hypothetical protein